MQINTSLVYIFKASSRLARHVQHKLNQTVNPKTLLGPYNHFLMSERTRIIPQIPDSLNKIRTYSNDYVGISDTESEEEHPFEADGEDEAQQTTELGLAQNEDYMETKIADWNADSQIWENQEFQLVVKPMASKLSHTCLF